MQTACNITEKGFRRLLGFIKPGVWEYEIEAELLHEFIRNRSKGPVAKVIIGLIIVPFAFTGVYSLLKNNLPRFSLS